LVRKAARTDAAHSAAIRSMAGSSFYLAMRILPRAQRDAMFAIYAYCRIIDDIADEPGRIDDRLGALEAWRDDIEALYAGHVRPPTRFLAAAVEDFDLRKQDFLDLVDGVSGDVRPAVRLPDDDALDRYCDRVASAAGRLSVRIFGMPEAEGVDLAHHLGRALQLTNILRDLEDDARLNRIYLPASMLAGAPPEDAPAEAALAAIAHPAAAAACRRLADRARVHFEAADGIMRVRPKREVKTPLLMAAAYRDVLDGMVRQGFELPRERVRVNKIRVATTAARLWLAR